MRQARYQPTTSLMIKPSRADPNRSQRRLKKKKIPKWSKVHKASNGKVYRKGVAGYDDEVMYDSRYDGRFR